MVCANGTCNGSYGTTFHATLGSAKGTVRYPGGSPAPAGTTVAAYSMNNAQLPYRTVSTNAAGEFDFNNALPELPPSYKQNNWALQFVGITECPGPCRADYAFVAGATGVKPSTHPSADTIELRSSEQANLDLVLWDPEPVDIRCKQCGNGPSSAPCAIGQPISVTTGNAYLDQDDVTFPTLGSALVFTRSYNSQIAYVGGGGAFGPGWNHPFERHISTTTAGILTVREADGTPAHYRDTDGDSEYEAWLPRSKETWIQPIASGYTRYLRHGGHETYDTQGRQTEVTDASGHTIALERDGTGRLSEIRPPGGRNLMLSYTPQNRIESISGPGGLLVTYQYKPPALDLLERVTYPDGRGYTFVYNSSSQLTEVRDLSERLLESHTYDGFKATTSEIANGVERYTLDYSNPARTKVTDALGNETTYDFTIRRGIKLVTKVTGPCTSGCGNQGSQASQEWTYDESGWVTSHKDGNGRVTEYAYDSDGDLISMTEATGTPLARATQYTNDATTGLRTSRTVPSVVNPAQPKATTYQHENGQLRLLTEAGLLGDGTAYSYSTTWGYTQGKVTSLDGPRTDVSDVTTFDYDDVTGDLVSVMVPHTGTTVYSDYTPLGQPQTITDPNNVATTYTYDRRRRVETMTLDGDTTTYHYSPTGKLERVGLSRGNSIHYDYDIYDRLEKIRDHLGNYIKYTYDAMSRREKEEIFDFANALQKTLSFEYDSLHRLEKVINPDAQATFTEYDYDPAGNRTSVKNPRNYTTIYHYDELNRLFESIQPGTITTKYGYNGHDDLRTVTDPENHVTTYVYDDMGRVYREISPDSGTTTYAYDPAGNRTSKADARGIVVTYTYDALNRLTLLDYPEDDDVVYTYDTAPPMPCSNGKGHVCRVVDQAGTTNYNYTPKGHLWQDSRQVLGHSYLTSYSYDANGNVETVTYPSGRVVTYGLDMADRVTSVTTTPPAGGPAQQLASAILYKPFGGMRQFTYGNNLMRTVGYDNQYRLASIQSGTVQNLAYTPDPNGNVETLNNLVDPSRNKTFVYDALDRLTNASGPWGNLGWTYDGVGNRLTYSGPEGNRTYAYELRTNRLASVSGPGATTFGYDNSGNTTSEALRTYYYNESGRLGAVDEDGHSVAGYSHSANGQRAIKVIGSFALFWTVFHYDQTGLLLAETTETGATGTEYIHLNGQPLAKVTGTALTYIHPDHLGTPVMMTNSMGANVWEIEARPFGDAASITGLRTLNLRFPGQYFDTETGLHQNWWRNYHSVIGRYIEPDPIEVRNTANLYTYVQNNPLRFLDPLGLMVLTRSVTRRVDYNVPLSDPSSCGAPGCTTATGTVVSMTPCREACGRWAFDATVDIDILTFYSFQRMQPYLQDLLLHIHSNDTLRQHEDRHVDDIAQGVQMPNLNLAIQTEFFGSPAACESARQLFAFNLQAAINGVISHSSGRWDNAPY